MTQFLIASIGSYPRIGEEQDQQRHRRGLTHYNNKSISAHAFRDVEQSVINEVVREQIAAGLDEVTDGHVSWNDPISHFCLKLSGIKSNGIRRYFDTNFYYRVPVITAKPKRKEPLVLSEFKFTRDASNKPVRAVLTGPYTLARHTESETKSFDNIKNRVDVFTEILSQEIKQLAEAGATQIQIDEPSIGRHPEDMALLQKSFEQLSKFCRPAKLSCAIYHSPLAPLYNKLKDLPVDTLFLDFTYDSKKLFDELMSKPLGASIGFGFINARTSRLEAIDPIMKMLRDWIEKKHPQICYLTPSCGLEYLTRETALAKLRLMSKICSEAVFWRSPPSNNEE